MANPVLMPKQGITVESCILTKWNVKVGDTVKVGDVLFSFETDKSSIEYTAEVAGEILALLCEEGDEVPVLSAVAVIGNKGEDIAAFKAGSAAPKAEEIKAEPAPATAAPAAKVIPADIKATPVAMPKSGITVESCILTKINVKVGDTVKLGDNIFSYETDKSSFDLEAEISGEVLAIFYAEGDEVPVGSNVLAIGEHGVDASCFAPNGSSAPKAEEIKAAPAAAPAQAAVPAASAQAAKSDGGRIFASPRAKSLAEKLGVDLATATPTGPNGRIIERDVREASVNPKVAVSAPAMAAPAAKAENVDVKAFKDEKMSNIRKVIAKNMVMSLSTMAQLTHTLSFDCT
ncbi:MAG: E3 binding domain-containing protein, partial [Clostridia bacterium]|nr:E3 binding domain-containing protein [Clostridia bacterium]